MLQNTTQIPADSIHRVVEEVFSAAEYNRFSPWQRIWAFLSEWFGRFLAWLISALNPLVPRTNAGRWLLLIVLILLIVVAVAIGLSLWRQREARMRRAAEEMAPGAERSMRSAEALAAEGMFTEAAHALYAALLASIARRGHVRLHHSKTVGDYVRELRRQSPAVFTRFREFARTYELVIYGLGTCDRDRYERLRSLALPVVRTAGTGHE